MADIKFCDASSDPTNACIGVAESANLATSGEGNVNETNYAPKAS